MRKTLQIGPGKYDNLATYVREASGGKTVLVAVLYGKLGSGFSVQSTSLKDAFETLPALLRAVADEMERRHER